MIWMTWQSAGTPRLRYQRIGRKVKSHQILQHDCRPCNTFPLHWKILGQSTSPEPSFMPICDNETRNNASNSLTHICVSSRVRFFAHQNKNSCYGPCTAQDPPGSASIALGLLQTAVPSAGDDAAASVSEVVSGTRFGESLRK